MSVDITADDEDQLILAVQEHLATHEVRDNRGPDMSREHILGRLHCQQSTDPIG